MKKLIIIIMALVVMFSCVACSAKQEVEASAPTLPGIVGTEHLEVIKDLDRRYNTGEFKEMYTVEMRQFEGYWAVYVNGSVYGEALSAVGFYDHMPSEEEIDILWTNRVPEQQLNNLLNGLGF